MAWSFDNIESIKLNRAARRSKLASYANLSA